MAELRSRRARALALLGACIAAGGCDGCGAQDAAVPFKRVEAVAPTEPSTHAPDAAKAGHGNAERTGLSHPERTTELQLGGGRVHVEPGRSLRASLELDLDANGTLDGLFVVAQPDAAPELAVAMLGAEGPGALTSTGSALEVEPGCALGTARLASLGASYVLLSAEFVCTAPSAPVDAGLAPVPHTQAHSWIVAVEPMPRVLEHLWRTVDAADIAVTIRSSDSDSDGHEDIVVGLDVGGAPSGERTRFELTWLNRPSGLGREPHEPEKTLLERANSARAALKKEPARALALADETLRLHSLLCRESGNAALGIGSSLGLSCGASVAAGRATAVRVAALAKGGHVFETLRALASLEASALQVPSADAERARSAATTLPRILGVSWQPGPRLPTGSTPAVHRPRIAFLDEDHLLLRGNPPLSHALSDGSSAPTSQDGESRVLSPDGTLAVGAVFRACDGYRAQILNSSQLVQGLALGTSRAEPLLAPAPPPPGSRCPGSLARTQREDAGGFEVLDWSERGLLLARDEERWLLPLDATGAAAAPARQLGSNEGVVPRSPGAISADGSRYVRTSSIGVVRITLGATLTSELLPMVPGEGSLTDAVLSPSGRSIAVLRGTQVYVARLGASGTPTTTTPVPSAATPSDSLAPAVPSASLSPGPPELPTRPPVATPNTVHRVDLPAPP